MIKSSEVRWSIVIGALIGGCVVPHTNSPLVVPVTNIDSIGDWLPAELRTVSTDFIQLRSEVASLSAADAALRILITPDGRFEARVPDEVMDRFGGSAQDSLLTLDGTWQYTTDNHKTVGIQFTTSEEPKRTFLGYMHRRKGRLIMIIAIGDYDSGDLLILKPNRH
jgi:hypothetical protein